ncbi:MAG TPA: histidine phosphatase family protein [Verrucomicrobiae bacterium]|nr:histidine phosphatase family protein [Verrucomicrobiae bacterium]
MTTFYLVRHASNDLLPHTLAGRMPGVHLNEKGRREAERLADRLAPVPVHQIFSSPLERAKETANPLAKRLGLKMEVAEALNEIDFGDWTGKRLAELDCLERWRRWNCCRGTARIPNGETMLEVQNRMVDALTLWRQRFPDETIALFGHGDPIRATLLYFAGMPPDFIHRLEVSPAGVSIVELDDWAVRVRAINRL